MTMWFKSAGGKVGLEQQLIGLEYLWPMVSGRSVLDVGCAEGDIAELCVECGASYLLGVENRQDAVRFAKRKGLNVVLGNVEEWLPEKSFDVVMLLGVLHKLRNPAEVLERMLKACTGCCVVRLPGAGWPVLTDERSGSKPIDLHRAMVEAGWRLEHRTAGPRVEGSPAQWVGYMMRVV